MLELSLPGLINFILGIASGFVLFTVTYIYFIIRGKKLNIGFVKKSDEDVSEEDLRALVIDKQKTFKAMKKKGHALGKLTFDLSFELVEDIAKYYFPDSKHPMLELSIDEMLTLNHYITQRIENILEQPILKNTRNVRVTRIVRLYQTKRALDEKKIVKAAKNKTVKKSLKYTLGAINLMNPAYWFRKLVVNTSVDYITTKVGLLTISVVAEETIKVYSKKLFDKDVELDFVDKELRALEQGMDEE